MRTIYEAKKIVLDNYGKKVKVKVHGIRNKNELIQGIISECYKNVFIITTDKFKRCFTYKDLLLGIIKFVVKQGLCN